MPQGLGLEGQLQVARREGVVAGLLLQDAEVGEGSVAPGLVSLEVEEERPSLGVATLLEDGHGQVVAGPNAPVVAPANPSPALVLERFPIGAAVVGELAGYEPVGGVVAARERAADGHVVQLGVGVVGAGQGHPGEGEEGGEGRGEGRGETHEGSSSPACRNQGADRRPALSEGRWRGWELPYPRGRISPTNRATPWGARPRAASTRPPPRGPRPKSPRRTRGGPRWRS